MSIDHIRVHANNLEEMIQAPTEPGSLMPTRERFIEWQRSVKWLMGQHCDLSIRFAQIALEDLMKQVAEDIIPGGDKTNTH